MAVKFRQIGFKLYDQLSNGLNFDTNLTKFKDNLAGFVGGRYRAVIDFGVYVNWYDDSDQTTLDINFTSNWLQSKGVKWSNEGFNVGDIIEFWAEYQGVKRNYAVEITSIIDDRIYFTIISGSGLITASYTGKKAVFLQSQPTAINYNFGFVENSDEYSNNSILTGESQTYYGAYQALGVATDLTPKGANKDWVSGNCKFEGVGVSNITNINNFEIAKEFSYQITHEFILNPFYEEGQISNLTNENGIIQPPYLLGDFSLKYVYEPELRRELSNPNTAVSFKEENQLGSVAYFNENYNGYNNPYSVVSVAYEDAITSESLESINPSINTLVDFRVSKPTSITANHTLSFNIFKCSSQEEYLNTTQTDLEQNFLFDNLTCEIGGAFVSGTGIVKNVQAIAQTLNEFQCIAEIGYSNEEQLKINENDFFVISVAVQDNSLTAGNEDTVNLLLDVKQYDTQIDISGLATMPVFDLFDPKAQSGYSSLYAFNEDNINAECQLVLDLTKEAFLNSISTKLLAYNPSTFNYFELDNFNIDFESVINSEGQQIDYSSSRVYPDSIRDTQGAVSLVNTFDRGNELVTNGDFSNGATGWTLYGSSSVVNEKALITWDIGQPFSGIEQNIISDNKKYLIEFNAVVVNGFGYVAVGGNQQNIITETKKYSVIIESANINNSFSIARATICEFTIDNVSVKELIEDPNKETYQLNFGQKINWKDWIYNRNADTIFYNNQKPNNNLNFKASNYSNLNGYEIRLGVLANIYGVDDLGRSGNTDYLFLSQKLNTADYDSNTEINGTIELFDTETNASLGTSPRSDKDSLFKATWTNLTLIDDAWGINRIERNDNVGNTLYELSSLTDYIGGILKPVAGETKLKIEQVGADIVATCLIDYTKLEEGVSYNLSSRINLSAEINPDTKLKTTGAIKLKTDAVVKLKAI